MQEYRRQSNIRRLDGKISRSSDTARKVEVENDSLCVQDESAILARHDRGLRSSQHRDFPWLLVRPDVEGANGTNFAQYE